MANKLNVKIGDIAYDCRYLIEGPESSENNILVNCVEYKKASIFFNYILDLFRAEINRIEINLNRLNNIKLFISEPCFNKVQKITLLGNSVPAKKVIDLYDCFDKPVLETIVESHINLNPTSKLLQSEILQLFKAPFISLEHLLAFSGKYIDLSSSSILEEHIIAFVKHWLDGNYPTLEGACISCPMELEYETEKVLDEFNTKRWNPAERAQSFIFKTSFSDDEKDGFPIIDCSNGNDLERNDGLMATMQFEDHDRSFLFCVWQTRFP
ncbi:unnamed protein product [Caenorhabditis brenneri]